MTITYFRAPMDSIFHNDSLILEAVSKDHFFTHSSFLKCAKGIETTLFQIFKLQRNPFAFVWYCKQFRSRFSSPQWYISNPATLQRHINNHLLGEVVLNTSFCCNEMQSGFDEYVGWWTERLKYHSVTSIGQKEKKKGYFKLWSEYYKLDKGYGTKGVVTSLIIKAIDEYNYPKHISSNMTYRE